MTRRAAIVALWLAITVLIALGVGSAVKRGLGVTSADPTEFDREQLEVIARVAGVAPGSAEHGRLALELPASNANLNAHPRAALCHLVPGALFFLFAPLQFSRRLRARYPTVHRWNGRVMLAMVAAAGGAGMYLGLTGSYGGVLEAAATTLFGGFFLFAGARGYAAIRRRDIVLHREWMIRMFALAIGISVIRVIAIGYLVVAGTDGISPQGFVFSLWTGWLLTIAVAELWIHRTRVVRPPSESIRGLQPL